jgi:hypothetical protein
LCGGSEVLLTSSLAQGNQWYKNGVLISGATGKTLLAKQAGSYEVKVNNAAGCSYTSLVITVNENINPDKPKLTPAGNQTTCSGTAVVLTSSAATGNQWLLNGTPLLGATAKTYSVIAASGDYSVRVTNTAGCVALSDTIKVNVLAKPFEPLITSNRGLALCPGEEVTLSSSYSSGNQWYRNNVLISGATGRAFKPTDSGNYTVIVTNTLGCSTLSAIAAVTYNTNPAKPAVSASDTLSFCAGGSVVLTSTSVSGNQWYKNGVLITSATAIHFTAVESGEYTVRVSNVSGCFSVSDTIQVNVNNAPAVPQLSASGPLQLCPGKEVTLTSNAPTGNQWYSDNRAIIGSNANSLKVTTAGKYKVRVTGTNNCFSESAVTVTSLVAAPPIPVITAGGPTSVCAGNMVMLSSSADMGNQWLRDGVNISGATAVAYQAVTGGLYSVSVTNVAGCSSVSTSQLTVKVNPNPSKPVINWNGARFSAPGGFAGYRWFRDGIEISGAETENYQPQQNGLFKVTVKDLNNCTATSDEFNLVVTGISDLRVGVAVISCYPNPAREAIYIDVRNMGLKKLTVRLYDLHGRLMTDKILINNGNTLFTDRLPSGIYYLLISDGKEKSVQKIALIK